LKDGVRFSLSDLVFLMSCAQWRKMIGNIKADGCDCNRKKLL